MYNNSNFRKHKQAYELAKDAGGGGAELKDPILIALELKYSSQPHT